MINRLLNKTSIATLLASVSMLATTPALAAEEQATVNYTGRDKVEYDYAYALGVQATVYGWAPVMMDVALELQTSVDAPMDNGQAPVNQIGPITRLWDHRDRSYTTPNNDTLYLQAWADLEEEPLVLFVPEIKDRYWIEQIVDMYTESVVDLGNATVGDQGGYFVLAKRGYEGELPEGVEVHYSNTRYIWLAGRLGVENAQDEEKARELQSQFRLMSLSEYPNGGVQPEPKHATGAPTVQFPQGIAWFERLDKVLSENPLAEDKPVLESFEYIGIGNDGLANLSDVRKHALENAFKDGFAIILDAAMHSDTPVNGWNWEYKAGAYGADYLQRAAINMNSIGLNSPERAMYPKRYVDSEGELLHGENSYTVTFPADMQVNEEIGGFWSVTMYDAQDRFMVENAIDRFKIGSMTEDLVYNKDGSLTITISHQEPTDATERANWLPAPNDSFMLQVRLYEPKESVYTGQFSLPEMYKNN
ncbi:putative exported protein [Vibrio maritimus]|uniref:Putative exported protein n=1 Tax=Vibrio maritimus TaxID=990268 RepID=A0A090T618_9VIBR|nr:putative exported protein [Vibrio maritimus]